MRVTTLDERTGALLERLETLCAGGGYHIFEGTDLAPDAGAEVRYAEGGTYCLKLLPAGRAYAARARERLREEKLRLKYTALSAFFGALAGGLICTLLTALVLFVGG